MNVKKEELTRHLLINKIPFHCLYHRSIVCRHHRVFVFMCVLQPILDTYKTEKLLHYHHFHELWSLKTHTQLHTQTMISMMMVADNERKCIMLLGKKYHKSKYHTKGNISKRGKFITSVSLFGRC